MRCLLVYVFSVLAILAFGNLQAQETLVQYLSGTGEDNTVKWQFYCTEGRNSGKWTTIPVPSNWELQGFGKYNYGFAKDKDRGMEKGLYKYSFKVPAGWKGKVIDIVFEGAMTDTEVKINGKSAGPVHEGSYYRFKYDISNLLNYGKNNLLEATVAKHSANESVNQAERRGDFWIFGGIFRPVYLEALPAAHIKRVDLNADSKGNFTSNVFIDNVRSSNAVSAQLYTLDGKPVGNAFTAKINNGDSVVRVNTTVSSPKLWTSESPNLYRVEYTLLNNGQPVHTTKERFGFRTVEVRERDGVYVNGTKVKFKGVCRHSFWPTSGRTMSERLSLLDVQLMKDMNMNAVRMSHYPGDKHFYELCDSLGLYVLDELAGWHGNYDTITGTKLTKALVAKNGNHPSVIMWANGNEGGHNYALDPVFAEADMQKRPVIHPWEAFGGFDTQHYREYNYGVGNYDHGKNIVMPTEFLHGMYDGGHGAGLEDYWEAMWSNPLNAGGFLWDYADQGVVRKDKNDSIDTDKNRGPDGIVGPYRQKEGSYFTIKEVWSPVHVERREMTEGFDGRINLENRYHFTNTNQCSFSWTLKNLQDTSKPAATGTIPPPSIEPLQKGSLQLSLPQNWKSYDVLYVTAFGADKKEIFTWSFPITRPADLVETLLPQHRNEKVQLLEKDTVFTATANGITVAFNKINGKLVSVKNSKGNILFTNGPVIQEGVNNFKNFTNRYEGNNLIISSTFDRKNSYNVLEWTIYPSGIVKMKVNYFPGDYFTSIVGVNFSFPESEMKGVEYMGNGPYRVWRNRLKGNKFGVWKKDYNNTETGEVPFIYPEFKGYHSNMYWCKFLTTGQPFKVFTPNEDLFFRLFTPAYKEDQWRNYVLNFPTGDISFLQGIPGIGTKTQKTENSGPMGMKNVFYDYEKDPKRWLEMILYFDFSGK
ncbi:MAG: glycoside hydrolase family 2 sugar binding [Segetibacter sp.]|nr:glycoside hydrolase family 2 sugar binding [Segetibacter sp.]